MDDLDGLPVGRPGVTMTGAFAQRYGRPAAGVWSAPGRVNLIGEHTDYNRGRCLPIALPQRAWLAAARRDDDLVRLTSLDLDETVEVPLGSIGPGQPGGWAAYQAGVLWAMRQAGWPVGGVDALLRSDVPIGAGLSSSAAVEGCLAVALSDLFKLDLTRDDTGRAKLAAVCQRAENEIAGAPTGGLDQTAVLRARAGQALLIDFDDLDAAGMPSAKPVPFEPGADGLTLLVIDTQAKHSHADGPYGARRAACQVAAQTLGVTSLREITPSTLPAALQRLGDEELQRLTRHVVTETARVGLAADAATAHDWAGFGALMDASHASLRDDYRVSCEELDTACAVAKAGGALGARLTGGGFGGSAIALVDSAQVVDITAALGVAYQLQGWAAPRVFPVQAGPAAV